MAEGVVSEEEEGGDEAEDRDDGGGKAELEGFVLRRFQGSSREAELVR